MRIHVKIIRGRHTHTWWRHMNWWLWRGYQARAEFGFLSFCHISFIHPYNGWLLGSPLQPFILVFLHTVSQDMYEKRIRSQSIELFVSDGRFPFQTTCSILRWLPLPFSFLYKSNANKQNCQLNEDVDEEREPLQTVEIQQNEYMGWFGQGSEGTARNNRCFSLKKYR